jgi:nitrite reductase/ring-hydroxylating ferredoxin subunit/uncharacterized membrane protein
MPLFSPLDRATALTAVDPVLDRVAGIVAGLPVTVRDALHGRWLGHPLHPAVAQVPVGLWTAAAVLDGVAALAPSRAARAAADRCARTLVATGLAAVPATVLPGAVDWSQLHPEQRRVGAVHAVTNTVAAALLAASLVQRRRGRPAAGRAFGLLGVGVAAVAAGMGGHLSYRFAAGANHAEHVRHRTEQRWLPITRLDLIPDRVPQRHELGGTLAVVVRSGDDVRVLADLCPHLGGPLAEGSLDGDCIVCPWHGSSFRLDDGTVRHGPATAPVPRFEVRVTDGMVEARIREPEQDAGLRRLGEVTPS